MRHLLAAAFAVLASHAAAADMRMFRGQSGPPIAVPAHPVRIADLWFAHNALMVMLGAADRIVVTTNTEARQPWMFRVAPALRRAVQLEAPVPGAETLLAAHVDLAIVPANAPAGTVARSVNLPTVPLFFQDRQGLIRGLDLTADLLNDAQSRAKAHAYDVYLADVVARVLAKTASLPDPSRPRVLHIQSLHPLKVDGADTIIDDWIHVAGGRNAATGIDGVMKSASIEQVAVWNPDVIIIDSQAGPLDPGANGGIWRSITAVRAGRVLTNPHGVYTWDRYGAEYPLEVLWAAKTLHPDLFADTDMVRETMAFFRQFFSYPLTSQEAQLILRGERPDGRGFAAR